jgi:hypothetical protein
MGLYDQWNEYRAKIPAGPYQFRCIKAGRANVWHEGKGGWGRSEKIILWFEIIQGDYVGKILPMFLPMGNNGKVPQGSKYFTAWCVANGLRRPQRARLKEMPPSKFLNKVFWGEVVDVKPRWNSGEEQPELFHYSRIDALYELLVGDPDS